MWKPSYNRAIWNRESNAVDKLVCMCVLALSPGHSQILSRSRGEKRFFSMAARENLGVACGARLYVCVVVTCNRRT